MMRSMYSAISSLKAHQFKMDTVGNNIANVNTVGFKGSRVTFKETFNQTVKGAGGAQDGRGGTNPMQVGLGTDVGGVDVVQTRGAAERTDNTTDLMINGEGFFMVSDDPNYLNRSYTRAGNFLIDSDGSVVTQDGYKVLGYMADDTGRLKSNVEGLKIDKSLVYPPQATKPSDPPIPGEDIVSFTGNLNSDTQQLDGLKIVKTASPLAYYTATDLKSIGAFDPAKSSDPAIYSFDQVASAAKGKPVYAQKNDEMSKSLGRETTVEVYDDFGNVHQLKLIFSKRASGMDTAVPPSPYSDWQVDALYMDKSGAMIANGTTNKYTSAGAPADATGTAMLTALPANITDVKGFGYGAGNALGTFNLRFGKDGKVIGNSKMTFQLGTDLTKGAKSLNFEMDLSKMTQFSDTSNAAATKVKGYKQGSLDSFAVASNGEVVGSFSNGQRRVLARVGIANFKNPAGLQKTQSNMFMETRNSGTAVFGKPADNGFAELNPGSLEMSNVDLGREFTNMIVTQRGFQANSRVITTTDQMLEELVNLKR